MCRLPEAMRCECCLGHSQALQQGLHKADEEIANERTQLLGSSAPWVNLAAETGRRYPDLKPQCADSCSRKLQLRPRLASRALVVSSHAGLQNVIMKGHPALLRDQYFVDITTHERPHARKAGFRYKQ